ncbi:MAG: glutamate-1-semialdehyde 2,1-aminomutase, partial [Nitrososphaerota archaeon]|nr:glutamate-1-semialdehyde 2,1-aminomutase [Nitrososphaerota archaeon]
MRTQRSMRLHSEARKVMVGGVSSPVRAFRAVGGTPLFITSGRGSHIHDADGNSFIDYVCSWGPLILGHANPRTLRAVAKTARAGTSFGAPSIPELKLAQKICGAMPSIQKVRFVNSGTEATMSALRLARAYTGRSKLLKFEGCYHGHADPFLTRAGSGMATFDIPDSAGVPESTVGDTLTVEYNNEEELESAFRSQGNEIAAAIIEPVAGNMGVVLPEPGYLQRLRRLCSEFGSLLIFDEVITGFRVAPGGAQALYGVVPDLTCLGKIIGGGFPVGAYGGGGEIMRLVAPEGPVYQAGTLSGNPVAMAAGLATLSQLNGKSYALLEGLSADLAGGLREAASSRGVQLVVNRVGSMMGLFFSSRSIRNYTDAKASNHRLYQKFHRSMLESGVYLPPSP